MAGGGTDLDPAMMGILALLAADRAERRPEPELPTELVLDAAGLDYAQIGAILAEKPNTVRMRITRAKADAAKSKPGAKAK